MILLRTQNSSSSARCAMFSTSLMKLLPMSNTRSFVCPRVGRGKRKGKKASVSVDRARTKTKTSGSLQNFRKRVARYRIC